MPAHTQALGMIQPFHLEDEGEDVEGFYCSVVCFCEGFVTKQLKVFDFKSDILQSLAFLDPPKCQSMPPSTFSRIQKCLPVQFDKADRVHCRFTGYICGIRESRCTCLLDDCT